MPKKFPISGSKGPISSTSREFEALRARVEAATADAASSRLLPDIRNGDEIEYADKSGTFSKGLAQQAPGLVDLAAFRKFRNSTYSPSETGRENGAFALGLDWMLPPPKAASAEYAAELVELYWASLLRDRPFTAFDSEVTAIAAARELDGLGDFYLGPRNSEGRVTTKTLFRGGLRRHGKYHFSGETDGPYISQLLLLPARMGAQMLDRKFRTHRTGVDYLTEEGDWAWIQNGGAPSGALQPDPVRRHIRDGRGLTAFAHADEIFQSYYVAHRVMAELGLGPNPGSPFAEVLYRRSTIPFRGPDIVGMLNTVSRMALDAVGKSIWFHLRHRPESGGGLLQLAKTHRAGRILKRATGGNAELHEIVMSSPAVKLSYMRHGAFLLSQALPGGAPCHPSYPSDRGAVAGACVTALKYYYDCDQPISRYVQVIEPTVDGLTLKPYPGLDAAQMTFTTELSKLAHNIALGHGLHAGVNWRSDVDEGLLVGEAIAVRVLKAHALSSSERFSVKIRKFDGELETIGN